MKQGAGKENRQSSISPAGGGFQPGVVIFSQDSLSSPVHILRAPAGAKYLLPAPPHPIQ
jgi:hypothetical protein